MDITKETVEYVSHLARINLRDNELETLAVQLKGILDFIDKLNRLNVQDINPTSHILPLNNVLRDDLPKVSLSSDKVLSNAPLKKDNFFGVPKVIE
ncbi:MAG: Asp-tRNA(Asn)/Glu-tRNA(Gln) amidotransferase subunit GatC [Candidatus Omnitrophota bacterium]